MYSRKTKGQSTLEYVILVAVVVAALIAMGIYMKRGLQGRLRESTDQVSEQYSPLSTASNFTTVTDINQNEVQGAGGAVFTNIAANSQTKTGSETVNALANESWNAPQ